MTQLTPLPNSLDYSAGITFGPDGKVYIADSSGQVYQWDGSNLTAFTPVGVEGGQPITDLAFGPDGNMYVSGTGLGDILVTVVPTAVSLAITGIRLRTWTSRSGWRSLATAVFM